jgi:hypothetical protein
MSKEEKKVEEKAEATEQTKAKAKVKPTPKKKITASKEKAKEPEAKVEATAEATAEAKPEAKTEASAEAKPEAKVEPIKKIPAMPDSYCLDEASWKSDRTDLFSAESNECVECEKKYPECFAACREREQTLLSRKGGSRTRSRKSGTAKTPRDPGQRPQSIKIDDLIKSAMAKEEAVTTLAAEEFGGDEKRAGQRVDSHVKAIKSGSYCRAEAMKSFLEAAGW